MAAKRTGGRRVAVIMAGGSGERFWPLSREKRPKQLLRLTSERETLLEEAVRRIEPLIPADHVYIATSRILRDPIRRADLGIPAENVLAEPMKRNTAGCLVWVAATLRARFPGEDVTLAILTADHQIGTPAQFRSCVRRAMDTAAQQDALVTIGIRPTRPETGYGYIEAPPRGGTRTARRVAGFREKPNRELAEEFVDSGQHYWNSGMFFWRLSTFESEFDAASPEHGEALRSIADALGRNKPRLAEKAFAALPDISIDFALMEHARQVLMVEGRFPWDDVGAWDALERTRPTGAEGNVAEGDPVLINTRDSIVLNDTGGAMAVGVVGAEHLVVIVTKDAVLVAPKHAAQDVRLVARELKRRKARQV